MITIKLSFLLTAGDDDWQSPVTSFVQSADGRVGRGTGFYSVPAGATVGSLLKKVQRKKNNP